MKMKPNVSITPDDLRAIRTRILRMSNSAKSAHVGSALSCVEILASLFFSVQKNQTGDDKIIFSKGHAASALYAVAEHFGQLESKELDRYLQKGTSLWGHPSGIDKHKFIAWSSGSLGHGLAVGAGFAYSRKQLQTNSKASVYVVLSDGECNEGSVWEAALFCSHHQLNNLVAIVDYNKIQSFGRVDDVMKLEPFLQKWTAFGWNAEEVDGHDAEALLHKLSHRTLERPTCLIAHTVKGKGIAEIENTIESHYRPVTDAQLRDFANEK